jgi:diacylglycerol kinase family enzyme/membrane-associated phospholipid phosphatase
VIRALVVSNPVAAGANPEALRAALTEAFGAENETWRMFETTDAPHLGRRLDEAIAEARSEGCTLVLAAGGDGTVSLVAESLIRRPAEPPNEAAIIPMGTANVLARELGIPIDVIAAVRLAADHPHVRAIDTIECAGKHYLTQVGVGIDARMIDATTREAQVARGRLAYFEAFLAVLRRSRSHPFTLEVDGATVRTRALQVVVANVATLGAPPFTWGPGIAPDDGELNLCVFVARGWRDYASVLWRLLSRRHRRDERTRYFRVEREVRIQSSRSLPVQGDGDVIGRTPVLLRVVPACLRVVVPAPVPEGEAAEAKPTAAAPSSVPADAPVVAEIEDRAQELNPSPLLQRVSAIDSILFLKLNRLVAWPWFDRIMLWISRPMDRGEGWALVLIALALIDPTVGWGAALARVAALWLVMLAVNFPIKSFFRRQRPFIKHVDSRVIGSRPLDDSFPSGHTAAAFAGACLIAPEAPRLAPALFAYSALVAFSRVYLGVHYLSDVVIGAVVGVGLAGLLGVGLAAWLP